MNPKDKKVVVTGGSRGLGLGLVEALVAHGAKVTVVARDADALAAVRARLGGAPISPHLTHQAAAHRTCAGEGLAAVRARLGVAPISADVTDETAAHRM